MKKTKQKEVEIDSLGEALISAMTEGLAEMKKPGMGNLRVIKRELPEPIRSISKKEVKSIREELGASQAVMARLVNVPQRTWVSWETGARKPSGAALKLLDIARRNPDALLEA